MKTLPKTIEQTCLMLGINPPRLLTKADIEHFYPRMPLVAAAIWENIKKIQEVE